MKNNEHMKHERRTTMNMNMENNETIHEEWIVRDDKWKWKVANIFKPKMQSETWNTRQHATNKWTKHENKRTTNTTNETKETQNETWKMSKYKGNVKHR